jgi:hypothetical protein
LWNLGAEAAGLSSARSGAFPRSKFSPVRWAVFAVFAQYYPQFGVENIQRAGLEKSVDSIRIGVRAGNWDFIFG